MLYSADMAALQNQSAAIRESVGTTRGHVQVDLVGTVQYAGTVNGDGVENQQRHTLPMEFQDSLYRVNDGPQTTEYTTTEQVQVAKS